MDMKTIKKTSKCLISGVEISKILDFGMHPYADTFISNDLLYNSEPVYPLEVFMNSENGNIQLGCLTSDFDRYNLYSYSYTSSNSNFAKNHWCEYYNNLNKKFNIKDNFVVEIGSNDGFLISQFGDNNRILGIDSSKEMCDIAKENGVDVFNGLFNSDTSNDMIDSHGRCDYIIANNVFNHSNDPLDFAKGVSNLLNDDGVFVFELPYWFDTIKSGKFDQIYHEHVTYLTIKFAYNLLRKANLEIFDFDVVDYHGGSIRVFSRKSDNVKLHYKIEDQIKLEEDYGLFSEETYVEWQKSIELNRNKFLEKIFKLKCEEPNCKILGVGAAAKANTFLNYYRLNNTILDYITDASEHKINKFTPLSRIPIVSDDKFAEYDEVYAIILSWNISNDLKNILLKINPKIKFIEI
jgi:SAM-dependent methyltransferase